MGIAIQRKGARAGQSTSRIVFVSTIFGALLAIAALGGFVFHDNPVVSVDHYRRGVVQYAPDENGQCERFEFDNQTGLIQPKGATECDASASAPSRSTGSGGTLGGIRDYFRSH